MKRHPFSLFSMLIWLLSACEGPVPHSMGDLAGAAPEEATVPTCSEVPAPGGEDTHLLRVRAVTVVEGLVVPTSMDFAPDGRIFLAEREGRVRIVEDGVLLEAPWLDLDVYAEGEAGLLAVALAPDFAASGHVYVAATFQSSSDPEWILGAERNVRLVGTGKAARGDAHVPLHVARQTRSVQLRVYRYTEENGRGRNPTLIVDNLPASRLHTGSALGFGPDGMLYVSTGDALLPERAQEVAALEGKILRYHPDGRVPDDNPFRDSPVFGTGLRNVQGFDWHPATGEMFATEHGPSGLPLEGGRRDQDELNRVVARGNYGWPRVSGFSGDRRFIEPLREWTPAIAPSGLAIYTGDALPWFGNIFIGALRGAQLLRVVMNKDPEAASGWTPVCEEPLFENEMGRIRGVKMGLDGSLYFTTSNRDGRGRPGRGDDRLLRIMRDAPEGETGSEPEAPPSPPEPPGGRP